MKTSSSALKLVIFMVVTTILTLFLAGTIGTLSFGGQQRYRAVFGDVTGLLAGNDVRVSGVKVGQVDGMKIVDGTARISKAAEVSFTLNDGQKIAQSSRLQLRYRNLVGERYIAVIEGPGSADPLPENGLIPKAQTQDALDLTILFNGFRPLFQALDATSINQVAFELIQTLQGEGGTVESLMARTASLTNTLADRDAVIGRVITNLTTVLTTLDDRSSQLSDLVIKLKNLSAGFAQDRKAIGGSLAGIDALTSATASLLGEVRAPLREDIAQIKTLATTLNVNKSTVDGVLQRLPDKLNRIVGTATYGSWFNFYLCGVDGTVTMPGGMKQKIPQTVNSAARCNFDTGAGS